jgi:hypothetical protein
VEIIYKVAIGGMLGLLLWIAGSMKADFNKQIDDVKNVQKEMMKYYLQCKDDINDIKIEYPKAISDRAEKTIEVMDKRIEKLIAWFKENNKPSL